MKILPTMEVWRKDTGNRIIINESDYDPEVYDTGKPEPKAAPEESPKPKRNVKK